MIRNFLKTAIRSLRKNRVFSLINIAGLAVGLAVFILIMLWVNHETSYNNFHRDRDRIGAVMVNLSTENDIATFPACPSLLAGAMQKDLPAIEYAARTSWGDIRLFDYNQKNFSEYGLYVDSDFLKVFSFPLLKGNIGKVLREPHTVLITEKLAKKYFGDDDPIGKIINVEKSEPYRIEGVLKDVPSNATLSFDFLMPFHDYVETAMGGQENWTNNNIRTYVKLKEGSDFKKTSASLSGFMKRYTDKQANATMFLWNINDWYLRLDFRSGKYAGGGRIAYVRLFIVIAFFILLLACINFMNLSTARATQRAKEVGVRKVIGAGRRSLVIQFIGESVFFAFIAGLLALMLVILVLPAFNSFFNKQISIDYSNPAYILIYVSIILATGLLAGSYPSFVLSSFRPVKVLKSSAAHNPGGISWIRKGLVITQFAVSVTLIVGTLVVYKQVNYIKNKDLGYHRENLLWFPNNIAAEKNDVALDEFSKVPGVMEVGRASMTFTMPNNRGSEVNWPGKKPGNDIFFSFITADHNLINTMGIKMKEGRAFSKNFPGDTSTFILNEEAVRRMGLKDPVGQTIETYAGKGTVIGVASDFHIESMHSPIAPIIIECRPEWTWVCYVRTDGRNTAQTISGLGAVYKDLAPGYPFNYTFQDKEYERLYRSEQQVGALVNWFAFFAIFISALGLLGLTLFTVERKTKEIGIRKVLGASVTTIISLLSKQFVGLILLAIGIAILPAWYFMNNWLQDYTYRIDLQWYLFVLAGAIALGVALVTISVLALRAALANPVKSLRAE